jgi:hypothetical protein
MQMITHQQKQFQMPSLRCMIAPSGFEQDARNIFQAKLVYAAALAANCYEIGRAESSVKMSRMVDGFRTRRFAAVLLLMRRAIEVNRPYLVA